MVLRIAKRPLAWNFCTSSRIASIPNRSISTSESPLVGARCVITGASRGIGRAIALQFASRSASLLLIGRNESLLQEIVSLCTSISPKSSYAYKVGDISKREFWNSIDIAKDLPVSDRSPSHHALDTESSKADVSRLDVLVNAAGITHSSLFVRTSASQIDDVVQTNLMGTLWGSQIMGKKMMRNRALSTAVRAGKGVIVNISSLLATHGGSGSAAYAASKAGVLGLTRALAAELGPTGIRVNAVLPGYIETDMTRAMTPQARGEALSKIPVGRFGAIEEVADAAVFLASNAYANNCIINLDGGLSATVITSRPSR
ncbi:hypothetical protein MBLNU459_g1286t1 [Dothideomycetes sp. NU459]